MDRKEVNCRTLQKLELVRSIEGSRDTANAICFSEDCELLLTSSNDSELCVYSVINEPRLLMHVERPGGVTHITATHYTPAVLYASLSEPLVHYYDFQKDLEIWACRDHSERVIDLAMSPRNDCFLSISTAHRLLYSDLRQRNTIFHCDLAGADGTAACAIDPTGLIFGLSYPESGQTCVKLFDFRKPTEGPFETGEFEGNGSVMSVEFAEDGGVLLVGTAMNKLLIVNSFHLKESTWIDLDLTPEADSVAVLSSCSNYVLSGSTASGNLRIHESETGRLVWEVAREGTVQALAWNRKFFLFVSAALKVDFWIPNLDDSASKTA